MYQNLAARILVVLWAVTFKLASLRASLEFARLQAASTQREIRRFCRQESELRESIQFLMTIPGIGWIVASHLVARLGDWWQLGNVRQIAAFLGLVASEHSTGDQVERGRITHLGRCTAALQAGAVVLDRHW